MSNVSDKQRVMAESVRRSLTGDKKQPDDSEANTDKPSLLKRILDRMGGPPLSEIVTETLEDKKRKRKRKRESE